MPKGPHHRAAVLLTLLSSVITLTFPALAQPEPPSEPTPTPPPSADPAPQPARDDPTDPSATPPDRPITFELVGGGSYNFSSGLKDGDGDVSIVRAGGELNIAFPVNTYSRLVVNPGVLYSGYDFSNATTLAPGFADPWSDVWEYRIGATAILTQDRQLSYIFGATVDSSGEAGASFSETLTYSGIAGVRCALSENFAFTGGLVVSSRLEDDLFIFPLLGVEWKIDDHWTLSNTRARVQSEVGNGLALGYRFNEELELRLSGGYTSYRFRLDDSGFNPSGVGRDSRVPIALSADWNITPRASLLTTVGISVWQEYETQNTAGVTLTKVETDPQPFVSFVLSVRF